jgi:hypothetical protein
MLCVNSYKPDYIDECRSNMESQVAAYKTLLTTARTRAGTGSTAFNSAVARVEPLFFNNLVLEGFFVHRSRALEGKDGNPLNEFRMICTSLLQNHGVMCTDKKSKTIKDSPETSVLKPKLGDEIKLTESASLPSSKRSLLKLNPNSCNPNRAWR